MRRSLSMLLGSCLLMAAPAVAQSYPAGEAKLAQALEGRVAGEAVDCLYLRDIRSSRIIERTAILYETRGGTLYLNRPDAGASSLSSFDVLVTDTHTPQLCNIDVVHLYDSGIWMRTGSVFLGEFVPYSKPERN